MYHNKYIKYKHKYMSLKNIQLGDIKSDPVYYTHDNGGRPYKVQIENDNKVYVYKNNGYDEEKDGNIYDTNPIATFDAKKVFVGKSPLNGMTEFSGGHGPEFDGNSILLELKSNEYVHIGSEIFSFDTKSEIKEYVSPVGNSDVPYPFAVDTNNNYYLITFDVIVLDNKNLREIMKKSGDPNDYYMEYHLITPDRGRIPEQKPKINYENIDKYYVGKEQYTLTYDPLPDKKDRVGKNGNTKMYIVDKDKKKKLLTKDDYKILMKEFGKLASFEPLVKKKTYLDRDINGTLLGVYMDAVSSHTK